MWGRLGYPRRALRLHAAAAAIVAEHDGEVPDDVDDAAGAARRRRLHRERGRVASRIGSAPSCSTPTSAGCSRGSFGGVEFPATAVTARRARLGADAAARRRRDGGDLGVAVMELGALVCTAPAPAVRRLPGRRPVRVASGRPPGVRRAAAQVQTYAGTDRQVPRPHARRCSATATAPVDRAPVATAWDEAVQRDRALDVPARRRAGRRAPRRPLRPARDADRAAADPMAARAHATAKGRHSSDRSARCRATRSSSAGLLGRPLAAERPLDRGRRRDSVGLGLAAEGERRASVPSPSTSTSTIWPGTHLAVEDLLGEHVLDLALDRAAQRPGAEHRVEATRRQQLLGRLGQLERHVAVLHPDLDGAIM